MVKHNHRLVIILVTSLFFMWAVGNGVNGLLIKHFRETLHLSRFAAGLVDTAFYLGYFFMAIPTGIIIRHVAYKGGIIIGLILFAGGSFLFYPASNAGIYIYFLIALFIIASGITFLETCANAYIVKLGDANHAEQRLNLAQSFNGVGWIVTVYFGGKVILTSEKIGNVYLPYLVIGCVLLALCFLFIITNLPKVHDDNHHTKLNLRILTKYPHLLSGVIAQFCYVGIQAGVWGYFLYIVNEKLPFLKDIDANNYYTGTFFLFMTGRFVGTFLMNYIRPAKLLTIYSICIMLLLVVTIFSNGYISIYALMSVSFFLSISYPTIFSLSLKHVGDDTKIAASFLVMSIIGGALLPPVMGFVADNVQSVDKALWVPIIACLFILYFAIRGHIPKQTS